METFTKKVKKVVQAIPKGETMTYSQVALEAGSPGAARAVGNIMKHNYDPTIPCHRVIRANGKIGDYNRGGSKKKTELLTSEGAL